MAWCWFDKSSDAPMMSRPSADPNRRRPVAPHSSDSDARVVKEDLGFTVVVVVKQEALAENLEPAEAANSDSGKDYTTTTSTTHVVPKEDRLSFPALQCGDLQCGGKCCVMWRSVVLLCCDGVYKLHRNVR